MKYDPGNQPLSYSGALFLLSAIYDETLFEVRVTGSVLPQISAYTGTTEKRRGVTLGSFKTLMFQDNLLGLGSDTVRYRQSEWWTIPDFIEVDIKEGRTLAEAQGASVRLMLHSLGWSGDYGVCTPQQIQMGLDYVQFERESVVDVGVCRSQRLEDWFIEPPPLEDECAVSSLPQTAQQTAEFEAIGLRVVNDLNVELPSMRVGHNRWRAGNTLAETLGIDAHVYSFARSDNSTDVAGFIALNLFGVWFAVEDVPGWTSQRYSAEGLDYVGVTDPCANVFYEYLRDTETSTCNPDPPPPFEGAHPYPRARLQRVLSSPLETCQDPDPPAGACEDQRTFAYDTYGRLTRQEDRSGHTITYTHLAALGTDPYPVTIQGDAGCGEPECGTRLFELEFGAPFDDCKPSLAPLAKTTIVGGGERRYEWYATTHPATNRKLKAVKEGEGPNEKILAAFEYDLRGRMTKRTHGAFGEVVSEFLYDGPDSQDPDEPYSMEARFYVTSASPGDYQATIRMFDKRHHVIELTEYHDLSSTAGTSSVTRFNYHNPPDGTESGEEDLFYHQVCPVSNQYIVLTRYLEKTWPSGQMSEYSRYDCGFNLVETFMSTPAITAMPDDPVQQVARTYATESGGQVWGVTQLARQSDIARGAEIDLDYDANGYLTLRQDPEVNGFRAYRQFDYDPQHRIACETRNNGSGGAVAIEYGYDEYNNLTRRTENPGPDEVVWQFAYDAFGDETKRIDPDGYIHMREYNDAGLLSKTYTLAGVDPDIVLKQTNYEYGLGRVICVEVAGHEGPFAKDGPAAWVATEYEYDEFGRITRKTITPGNYLTTYEYDLQDRLAKITFPDGIWKQTIRDGRGQIVETRIGPDPVLISAYEYDVNGNLTRRTCQGCPECGQETRYEYDIYNRRTAEIRVGQ